MIQPTQKSFGIFTKQLKKLIEIKLKSKQGREGLYLLRESAAARRRWSTARGEEGRIPRSILHLKLRRFQNLVEDCSPASIGGRDMIRWSSFPTFLLSYFNLIQSSLFGRERERRKREKKEESRNWFMRVNFRGERERDNWLGGVVE